MKLPVHLDNQATTPIDPRVLEAMMPFLQEKFGNAASVHHSYGIEAKTAVEQARDQLAKIINAKRNGIVFTSGATEAINLAIRGYCHANKNLGNHIITQTTEHKAVLDTLEAMAKEGWKITLLPVDEDGIVDSEFVNQAITKETVLVAIMHANNEIGTIQPIREIGAICRENNIRFLVDASQSFGKIPIDVQKMNIDLMAVSAHKIYGPKGIGLLYVNPSKPKMAFAPQITGGGHEFGYRSGTLPVHLIVGFAKAADLCIELMEVENERIKYLRDKMVEQIIDVLHDSILNGSMENRLVNNLNICFPGVDAETLISKMRNVACSTGSACSSTNLEPSHVLKAIGLTNEMAHSSIRFSFGRFNTEKEIDYAVNEIVKNVSALKEKSPKLQMILN